MCSEISITAVWRLTPAVPPSNPLMGRPPSDRPPPPAAGSYLVTAPRTIALTGSTSPVWAAPTTVGAGGSTTWKRPSLIRASVSMAVMPSAVTVPPTASAARNLSTETVFFSPS